MGQTYFSYAPGVNADGRRTRVSPAVFYYYKSFGAFAEYMRSSQEVSAGAGQQTVANQGWHVTASVMLTGEAVSYGAIRPRNNFDATSRHWGALQLLARYSEVEIDDAAFAHGLAASSASGGAHAFTVAANWFPNGFIKYYATFERTVFDATASHARPPENVILFRTQLAF
jgi:phosphate-selective porin OprO/OprP